MKKTDQAQPHLSGLSFLQGVSLAKQTSWLVGGPAEFFFEPRDISELVAAQAEALSRKLPITILGGGSNVLINDKGIRGLVLGIGKLNGIEILEEPTQDSAQADSSASASSQPLRLWALAGTPKSQLLKIFLKHKLEPACFLAGIPGQVGGGVVMNAGVGEKLNPREFESITEAVEVLRPDGKLEIIKSNELNWDYRHCHGWQPGIITRVLIAWPLNNPTVGSASPSFSPILPTHSPRDANLILQTVKDLNKMRLSKQPLEWPSCGSVFRNPLPKHAGQLIEQAGLKGYQIGGAQVSGEARQLYY